MTVDDQSDMNICRICFEEACPKKLVRPCGCKGSMGGVHIQCLENWIRIKNMRKCEVCEAEYKIRRVLKYGKMRSVFPFIRVQKVAIAKGLFRVLLIFLFIMTENLMIAYIQLHWSSKSFNSFIIFYFWIVRLFLHYFLLLECIYEINHIYSRWRPWRLSIFTIRVL